MFLWIGSRGTPSRNPLADLRVRRAIDLALDRRAIGLRATGRADAAAGALVLPAIFGYQPDLARTAHDPGAARGLLVEAGHRTGLTLPLVFRDATLARRSASVVAEQLAAVGIRTRPSAVSYEESLRPYREGAIGLFLDPWTFDVPDASSFLSDCIRTREPATGRGLLNPGFSSARLDAAIDLGSSLLDASARLEAIRRALRIADEEVPAVPLFEVTRLWGRARDVVFTPRVDGRIVLSEVSFRAPP
jgi:peptide/nickel transport system substrate-binding protein